MKQIYLILIALLSACTVQPDSTEKTLVAWVEIHDEDLKGGSVLTIQDGEQFDGIVLADQDDVVWLAGSNDDLRTEKDPGTAPVEETASGAKVQVAIVYEGNEIRIYRNAKLRSAYEAENVNLLGSETNFVAFGRNSFSNEEHISCAIEDARIYSKALSLEELQSLQPNEPSKIDPYAWWDFEGEGITERTGRFTYHNIMEGENVELKNGKLVLDRWGSMIAAREYEPEIPLWPEVTPSDWPTYHLVHPGPGIAEPGDPNPAWFYKGRYHMHYIYHIPYGFMFAHVSSTDMVHWEWHPTVHGPPRNGHGMFSGTGFFTREGQPAMIYHGIGSGLNHIAYGLDDHLDTWTLPEPVVPVDDQGEELSINQWDPDCWVLGDNFFALSGGKDPDLMKSEDLKTWKYLEKLLHDDYPANLGVERDEDISCANMFPIGDKWMLLCISHHLGCRYFLGDFQDEKYLPDFHAKMNWVNTDWEHGPGGLVYFAPESILAEDGRRVMWAWMLTEAEPSGIQSLPRELELPDDGVLRIRPLKELESLRYDELVLQDITVTSENAYPLNGITGDAVELEVTFKAPLPEECGISLLGDESGKDGISITAGTHRNTLGVGSIEPPFELREGEDLTLRIFIDKKLVEVFANDRQAAVIAHDEIRENPNISLFTNDRELEVKELKTWKMKSTYEGNTVFQKP